MKISLVVAMDLNGVIGRGGALPWRLPDDMAHFKRVTMGHPVVMGRRTWESLNGKALPGRRNVVVSRQKDLAAPGAEVVHSLEEAWRAVAEADEACVIGGTMLFAETLAAADVIHLTEVDAEVQGDTWFPPFDRSQWVEREVARHSADARHAYPFRILELTRA